jgi:hypothetical protein
MPPKQSTIDTAAAMITGWQQGKEAKEQRKDRQLQRDLSLKEDARAEQRETRAASQEERDIAIWLLTQQHNENLLDKDKTDAQREKDTVDNLRYIAGHVLKGVDPAILPKMTKDTFTSLLDVRQDSRAEQMTSSQLATQVMMRESERLQQESTKLDIQGKKIDLPYREADNIARSAQGGLAAGWILPGADQAWAGKFATAAGLPPEQAMGVISAPTKPGSVPQDVWNDPVKLVDFDNKLKSKGTLGEDVVPPENEALHGQVVQRINSLVGGYVAQEEIPASVEQDIRNEDPRYASALDRWRQSNPNKPLTSGALSEIQKMVSPTGEANETATEAYKRQTGKPTFLENLIFPTGNTPAAVARSKERKADKEFLQEYGGYANPNATIEARDIFGSPKTFGVEDAQKALEMMQIHQDDALRVESFVLSNRGR